MKKITHTFEFIQRNGLRGFTNECYYRITDTFYQRYFNVATRGMVSKNDLGINHFDSREYSSVWYRHTIGVLNELPVDKKTSTLLDYGCGKGRVIVSAARESYKMIIGVELSNLAYTARTNVKNMRHRKTQNIFLVQCDAQSFEVPPDVNIIYFFNPFAGSVLESVTRNIYTSYLRVPRKIYIIFVNNHHFDKIVEHQNWLTKRHQSKVHLNNSCGLYETR
jgi:predicted RNA methylase